MRAGTPAAVLLAGALALLAGCGGSTRTVIITTPPSTSSTAGASTSTERHSTTPAAGATTTSPTPSEPPTSFVKEAEFLSPSGNIGCVIGGGAARCDIAKRTWSPPPRPSSCPPVVDFGQGLIVDSSGPGRIVCAGDTARLPGSPKLPYGTASEVEDFTCVSRPSGVTCTDRKNGHGFFLSVQRYTLF